MNWIDVLLVVVAGIGVWSGWQRGFLGGAAGLLTWAGSFVAAFFLYPFIVPYLLKLAPGLGGWANALAFVVVAIGVRLLLNALFGLVMQAIGPDYHDTIVNRLLGVVPGAVNGVLQAIVLAALLLTLPFQNRVSDAARKSSLATTLAPPAFWLAHKLAPIFGQPLQQTFPKTQPEAHEKVTLPFSVEKAPPRPDLETEMLALVNIERKKAGLKPLLLDTEMTEVARRHSMDMFARGYFAHTNPDGKSPFDRMRAMAVRYRTAGENLALAQTLQQAHEGLMNSPGHRANILQPRFGRLGIGIVDGGMYGLMVTQNFRN